MGPGLLAVLQRPARRAFLAKPFLPDLFPSPGLPIMVEDKPFNESKGNSKAPVPESFPDIATCSAKLADWPEFYICLNSWGSFCPHVLLVERERYCNHPTKQEIYLRTTPAVRPGRDHKDGLK